MTKPDEQNESTRPLDMTTEEAIHFLFPKEVVEKLKVEANPKPTREDDNFECDDESYT